MPRVGSRNKPACCWSRTTSGSDRRLGVEPYRVRVIYGDTDQMGVVYYANYLRFFEGARGHFIRGLGLSYAAIESRAILLPVIEAPVHYVNAASDDDLLDVHLSQTHSRAKI